MEFARLCLAAIALSCAFAVASLAASPPPDQSSAFFAGEWSGTGAQGSYCYLELAADGTGWVLLDGGSGDWLGARIRWHNQRQSLQVDDVVPLRASPARRIMSLEQVQLGGGFNQSLRLTSKSLPGGCDLQRVALQATRLDGARATVKGLRPAGSPQ